MKNAGPCCVCRADIYLNDALYDSACRSEAIWFYCSYGHKQHFSQGETEETRLRRELNNQRQQNARLEDAAREARALAEKAERATKRLKKRAAAGSCPCCQRSFGNMAEHMRHQHPDWVKEQQAAKVVPIRGAA